jgi:DNA-binding transcriptional regulator YiaG
MTSLQYREAIRKLGLSQLAAARFLGVSPRTSQGWALGQSPVNEAAAKLLRLMVRLGLKPSNVT